jgi:hypothetical protein
MDNTVPVKSPFAEQPADHRMAQGDHIILAPPEPRHELVLELPGQRRDHLIEAFNKGANRLASEVSLTGDRLLAGLPALGQPFLESLFAALFKSVAPALLQCLEICPLSQLLDFRPVNTGRVSVGRLAGWLLAADSSGRRERVSVRGSSIGAWTGQISRFV